MLAAAAAVRPETAQQASGKEEGTGRASDSRELAARLVHLDVGVVQRLARRDEVALVALDDHVTVPVAIVAVVVVVASQAQPHNIRKRSAVDEKGKEAPRQPEEASSAL